MTETKKPERPTRDALERKIARQIANAYMEKGRQSRRARNRPLPINNRRDHEEKRSA